MIICKKIKCNYSATKTQRHKGNKNISILHSSLKEKNALQEKSRIIIFYNLGALVARCLSSYN